MPTTQPSSRRSSRWPRPRSSTSSPRASRHGSNWISCAVIASRYRAICTARRWPSGTSPICCASTTCTASIGTSVDSDAGSCVLQGKVPPFFPRGFFAVLSFSFGGGARCCSASRDLRSFNSLCNCVTAALHCVTRSSQRRITTSRWFAAVSTSAFACASISSFCFNGQCCLFLFLLFLFFFFFFFCFIFVWFLLVFPLLFFLFISFYGTGQ